MKCENIADSDLEVKLVDEYGFRAYLEAYVTPQGARLSSRAIGARISRAARVERELGIGLDAMTDVADVYAIRTRLFGIYDRSIADDLYNAVTHYYRFSSGGEVPRINE